MTMAIDGKDRFYALTERFRWRQETPFCDNR
jgi:hypothetical protein